MSWLRKALPNDARFIEVVLRESRRIVRADRVLIVERRITGSSVLMLEWTIRTFEAEIL